MLTIKRCLFLLCIGVILFTSCKKSTVPPHLQAVPVDASFVAAIESAQLMKKGGLDNLKEYKFFQLMNQAISKEEPETQEFITKLIENPSASGIDFDRFYIYGIKQAHGFYAAATFLIGNLATLEENLAYVSGQNGDFQIEQKDGYKIIAPDNSSALVWNERILLAFGGDLEEVDYGKSLSLSDSESVVSIADFREFQKQTCDAAFWAPYATLTDLVSDKMNIRSAIFDEFSSIYIHLYLHCNDGEIKISGKCTPQSEIDKYYAKYPIIKENFNDRLLEDFPETTYLSMKVAANFSEYLKLMSHIYETSELYDLQKMLKDPVAKSVIDGLDGDVLFNIYGFAQGQFPLPLLGISFSVKSEEDFNRILSLVPQEIVQSTGDFYTIGSMGIGVYVAYKDKRVLLTDDADAITAFVKKGYSKNLKNSPLATNLKNELAFVYINLDLSSYPGNIQALLKKETPPQMKPLISFLEISKDITMGSDKNSSYISLKFKDNKQNGLKLLLKGLDDINN